MYIEHSEYRLGQDALKKLEPKDLEEVLSGLDALDRPPIQKIPELFRPALEDIIEANERELSGLDDGDKTMETPKEKNEIAA